MKDKTLEQIQEDAEQLNSLIEKFVKDDERKQALYDLFSSDVGQNFLISPASSKNDYHNAYSGGLFDHTMNVFTNLMIFNESLDLGFDHEQIFVSCILHDVGKSCSPDLKTPFYVPAEEWKQKKGQRFDHSGPFMTTRDRTLFVIQSFRIKLSFEEYEAVMLNDGYILEGNRSYAMKECSLAFWLHVADSWSARQENSAKNSAEE